MDFDIFVVDKCDIQGYVCHFKKEDRFMNLSGFVTKDTTGKFHVFLSKKCAFNEFNIKESVVNAVTKK